MTQLIKGEFNLKLFVLCAHPNDLSKGQVMPMILPSPLRFSDHYNDNNLTEMTVNNSHVETNRSLYFN